MPRKIKASNIATGAVTAAILDNSGVTAGSYGSSTAIPVLTVNAKGQVTVASTASLPANLATETYVSTAISNLVNSAPSTLDTLNELAAALGNDASYATTITTALGNKSNTSTTVTKDSSTGAASLPSGTTAQRPTSPIAGYLRYNSDSGSLEFYNGSVWISTNLIPTVNSVSGTIYNTLSATLTLSIANATEIITVRFSQSGVTIADVLNIAVTNGNASVTVPSSVYNQSGGSVIAISVLNQDGTPSSNSVNTTIIGLPSGGTISTVNGYRLHTFQSDGTFSVPTNFTRSAKVLVVAGGAAGGSGGGQNGGGGGGAGGVIMHPSFTISANSSYSVTVGAGGSAGNAIGNSGSDSAFGSLTAKGGGGGGANGGSLPASGGSGGGRGRDGANNYGSATQPSQSGDSGTYGYGNRGGGGAGGGCQSGGGGGGAGGVGYDGAYDCNNLQGGSTQSDGGPGRQWDVNGSYYGGGGGGAMEVASSGSRSSGGIGGGGDGGGNYSGSFSATSGTNYTGGGGGGGQGPGAAGSGGIGVVIVAYQV